MESERKQSNADMLDLVDALEIIEDDIRRLNCEKRDKKQKLIEHVIDRRMIHCLTLNMKMLRNEINHI